ncbi:MAG: AAA family ATPase, partial [Mycoplasmataceae bacterium]|nr:AAA family ATPase [Mycoplasmataceae bacterium]
MKIIKIKIDNFKTFDSEEIIINEHLNYFVGINGVGKSNFLKAIEIFGNNETNFEQNAKDHNKDISIYCELELNSNDVESIIELVIEDWLKYLSLFLNDLKNKNDAKIVKFIFSQNHFDKIYKMNSLENIGNELNYPLIQSCIRDDLLKIKEINIKEFVKKIYNNLSKPFENKNLGLIKKISKENKFSVLASDSYGVFDNIVCEFSDFFKIKTIDNEEIFSKNNKNENKVISWVSIFMNYQNNSEEHQKLDLRKIINIFIWNNNSINFNEDLMLKDSENSNFLNNLLKSVHMSVTSLINETETNIRRKESKLNE